MGNFFNKVGKGLEKGVKTVANTAKDVVTAPIDSLEQGGKAAGAVLQGDIGKAAKHVGKGALEVAGQMTGPAGEIVTENLEDQIFGKNGNGGIGKPGGQGSKAPVPRLVGTPQGTSEAVEHGVEAAKKSKRRGKIAEIADKIEEMFSDNGPSKKSGPSETDLLKDIKNILDKILKAIDGASIGKGGAEGASSAEGSESTSSADGAEETSCSSEASSSEASSGSSSSSGLADLGDISDGEQSTFESKLEESPEKAGKYLASDEVSSLELMELSRKNPGKFAEAMNEMNPGEQMAVQSKLKEANRTMSMISNAIDASHKTSKAIIGNMRV